MLKRIICFKTHLFVFMLAVTGLSFSCMNTWASNKTVNNVNTTKSLLTWMEKHLNKQQTFTSNDLQQFFAPSFIINTNGRIVKTNPTTYHNYLYQFKNRIQSVHYNVQEYIDADDYVVVPFIINIQTINKKAAQHFRVIAIFKFDKNGKIILWQEVFTKTSVRTFC